jgi:DNA topoisomerase-1
LCPKCKNGEVIKKITKKKKIFYGCSNWPKCDFASWDKPTNQICPECSSFMIEKRNKIICSNKNCQSLKNK